MIPLKCPDVVHLQALLDGSGSDPENLIHHLETCVDCQQVIETLAGEPSGWEEVAECFLDPTREEVALQQAIEQLKSEDPLPVEDVGLAFLQPADHPNMLGMLGQYEVKEQIGRGGMGVVLRAIDPTLCREVAIKVMSPYLAGSPTARKRFIREAQAAAAVCHDHVVAIHGVSEVDGLPYLVMQYIAGESLQDHLDRTGPLELTEIVRIGLQTAQGLAAAHAQGLIHRDIKPANLLLENGLARVKITDFGLARMADDAGLTHQGVIAGTPEYMSPEQARCESVDHRADLFSLGSVLYACCTGVRPFRGSTAVAVLRCVNDQEPVPIRSLNPDVPLWLETLIARLMAKDPAARFQSAAEVAELLESYLAHLRQPTALPAPSLPASPLHAEQRRQHFGSRGFLATLSGAVVLFLAILGVAFWFAGAGQPDVVPKESKATFQRDFRSADESPGVRQMGAGVRWEATGARVVLPPGEMAGIALPPEFPVRGNFEITASYEVVKAEKPSTGYGVGVSLYAAIDPDAVDAVSLARRTMSDGTTRFVSNRMKLSPAGKRQDKVKYLASTATKGTLRIQRVGAKVRFLVAEGDNSEFQLVDEADFGTADLRFVQFGGSTGSAKSELDLRLFDLTVKADELPGLAESPGEIPIASAAAPKAEEKGWLAAGVLLALVVVFLIVLGIWLYRRHRTRRASAADGNDKRQSAPPVVFSCAGCQSKIKARVELAGKKVKCPGCGQAVHVPAIMASDPSQT